MRSSPFCFHVSVGGNRNGISSDFYRPIQQAGRKPFVVSADDVGAAQECQDYGGNAVFRWTGPLEYPSYHLDPESAAVADFNALLARIAQSPNFNPAFWLVTTNEPDKERSEWLGQYCYHVGVRMVEHGLKWVALNFSAGEPEPEHWFFFRDYLELCEQHPNQLAVGLHEYTLSTSVSLQASFPWYIGRFLELFDYCDSQGIARPKVFITEFGWTLDNVPPDLMDQIDWAWEELYKYYPEVQLIAIWYLGSGFGGIADRVQPFIKPLGLWNSTYDFDEMPEPPQPPPSDTVDLAKFILAEDPKQQHVLQCRFGDHFQGTQTLSTVFYGPDLRGQQKDGDVELIYWDDGLIYRAFDTSLGDWEGGKAFYAVHPAGAPQIGDPWFPRHAKVGDLYWRDPQVDVMRFSDCKKFVSMVQPSALRFEALHPSYTFDEGYFFPYPVAVLGWYVDDRLIERYWYGFGVGLVKWEQVSLGWKSYLVELYPNRGPQPAPALPPCVNPPEALAYYYEQAPVPPPPPSPPPVDNPFPVYSQRDTRWANTLLGTSQTVTIGAMGCLVACLGMMNGDTPPVANEKLKAVGGFWDNTLVIWTKIKQAFENLEWLINYSWQTTPANIQVIADTIAHAGPTIIAVDGQPGGAYNSHFVVALAMAEGNKDIVIIDPWHGDITTVLSRYAIPGEPGLARAIYGLYVVTSTIENDSFVKDAWDESVARQQLSLNPDAALQKAIAARPGFVPVQGEFSYRGHAVQAAENLNTGERLMFVWDETGVGVYSDPHG